MPPVFLSGKVREKLYHKANLVAKNGDVSPLCAKTPRAINLKISSWTLCDEYVTCPKCIKKLKEKK